MPLSNLIEELRAELTEMPHVEVGAHSPVPGDDEDFGVVDFHVERYPISKLDRDSLIGAFHRTGFVAPVKAQGRHAHIYFAPNGRVTLASSSQVRELPNLPDYWEKFLLNVTEAKAQRLRAVLSEGPRSAPAPRKPQKPAQAPKKPSKKPAPAAKPKPQGSKPKDADKGSGKPGPQGYKSGTVRSWNGVKMIKRPDGEWRIHPSGKKPGAAAPAKKPAGPGPGKPAAKPPSAPQAKAANRQAKAAGKGVAKRPQGKKDSPSKSRVRKSLDGETKKDARAAWKSMYHQKRLDPRKRRAAEKTVHTVAKGVKAAVKKRVAAKAAKKGQPAKPSLLARVDAAIGRGILKVFKWLKLDRAAEATGLSWDSIGWDILEADGEEAELLRQLAAAESDDDAVDILHDFIEKQAHAELGDDAPDGSDEPGSDKLSPDDPDFNPVVDF